MEDCLKCKNLDTSDMPNLFCKLNCELVNETEFRYCPKDHKSVVEFIEKMEELHKKEVKELQENYKLAKQEQNFWCDEFNKRIKEKDEEIEKWKSNWKIADKKCTEYEEQIKVLRDSQSSTFKTLMQTDEALRKTEKLLKEKLNKFAIRLETLLINIMA